MTLEELNTAGLRTFGRGQRGFTLTELLVAIAVIALLLSLLMPTLAAAKKRAERTHCLSNLRQLAVTMSVFTLDNADLLPPNSTLADPVASARPPWVSGSHHLSPRQFTNVALVAQPQYAAFAGYLRGPAIYKCPSDRLVLKELQARGPKVRSYALNSFIDGAGLQPVLRTGDFQNFVRQGDFAATGPSRTFTFMDVVPENVCYSAFVTLTLPTPSFFHLPNKAHGARGSVAFADAHVETVRWTNPRPLPPFTSANTWGHFNYLIPETADHNWLKAHATALRRR